VKVYPTRPTLITPTLRSELMLLRIKLREILPGHGATIPTLARETNADEDKVAWALQDFCGCRLPETRIDSPEGESYFKKALKLSGQFPQPFTDETFFCGYDS